MTVFLSTRRGCRSLYNTSWQVVEERKNGSSDPLAQYVWDIRYIDAPLLRWRDDNLDGHFVDSNETLYYTQDANFNVTALVNTSGTVLERTMYDPYGKATFYDANWANPSDSSDYANEVLFAGYRYDTETGLYHVRHRAYHPTLGRWLQRDPIGYADGMSLYQYALSLGRSGVDPWGLRTVTIRFLMHGPKPQAWPDNATLQKHLQQILDTCFKCCEDKVVAEVVDIKKRADKEKDLGLFPRPTPGSFCQGPTQPAPTQWNQEVHFRGESGVGEVAYSQGPQTSVAGPEFDKDIAANNVEGKERGYAAANVAAHEGFYLGMLDESDRPGGLATLLGKTPSDYDEIYTRIAPTDHVVDIPKEMCDRLIELLQVKCTKKGTE